MDWDDAAMEKREANSNSSFGMIVRLNAQPTLNFGRQVKIKKASQYEMPFK